MSKTSTKPNYELAGALSDLIGDDLLEAQENVFRAARRVGETTRDEALGDYLHRAGMAMGRVIARSQYLYDPEHRREPDEYGTGFPIESWHESTFFVDQSVQEGIEVIARDVTDLRRRMEAGLTRTKTGQSADRERSGKRYNELLEKVRELLPDHHELVFELDDAIGDYSNEVAHSAVRDHGFQILEMISGSDFEYKFLEDC